MSLDSLREQRTCTKRNISRIKNLVEASAREDGKTLSTVELRCRLGILESYFKQICSYQTDIEKLDPKDGDRAELEDLYVCAKMSIQMQLGEDGNSSNLNETTIPLLASTRKLPVLKLPTFSGKYSEYKNFISSFKQVIDHELFLTNIEKFNHLLNCLSGQALETVKAFQVTNENYQKALKRLEERYDNTTLIFMENITALFELPTMSKNNCKQLQFLVDNISAIHSSLSSIGSAEDICNAMLIYLVMQKVDTETQRKWKESIDYSQLQSWSSCAAVLERHCQFLESIQPSMFKEEYSKSKAKANERKNSPAHKGYTFSLSSHVCLSCAEKGHPLFACSKFKTMTVAERFKFVKENALCINCLSGSHQASKCTSSFRCKLCSGLHHSMLHRHSSVTKTNSQSSGQPSTSNNNQWSSSQSTTHTHVNQNSTEQVLLATATVLVRDLAGTYHVGKALLDSCSQVNFMTTNFSNRLRLNKEKHSLEIISIGKSQTQIKHRASTVIKSRFNEFELPLSFCITSHISYQPDTEIDTSSWKLPNNVQLADESFYKSNNIDMLIGAESFFEILSVGQIKLGSGLPILQKTVFGWVVSGKYQPKKLLLSSCHVSIEQSIDKRLEKLWELESIHLAAPAVTDEQSKCEIHFINTISNNEVGRLTVKLPFKTSPDKLGQSSLIARNRFLAQERRLTKRPDFHKQYVEFMQEYENLGHMSLVENPKISKNHYYIPHHFVLKPSSTTTKFRVVFDASCKTTSGNSLNDLLSVGPKIQKDIFDLLVNFRLYKYALTADIVKMYRQVLMHEDDRRYQYIYWRNSDNEDLKTYQLNTVTYGTASAPYLAVRCLHHLAEKYASEKPVASKLIKSCFYVDDLICGADSLSELAAIKQDVSYILNKGGFALTKWHSNHKNFVNDETIKQLNKVGEDVTSTLGIIWDQQEDVFGFTFVNKHSTANVTKRTILSTASSLFDPLGLLSPLFIVAKILLQQLWMLKMSWNESLPQKFHHAWKQFLDDMSSLRYIKIPRYCFAKNIRSLEIHGFADASVRAYGCCIYLRIVDDTNVILVQLLTSKSRVAPTKKRSLPKLELCAAHLLSKLFAKIRTFFIQYKHETYLWSDSKIVLHWIKLHSSTLMEFVGNRVTDIQDLTSSCKWRHVPTGENPADIVSRGSTVQELVNSIWFTGPKFLLKNHKLWPPTNFTDVDINAVNAEKRKAVFQNTVQPTNIMLTLINNKSSFIKGLRIVAWIRRFIKKCKKSSQVESNDILTADELEDAFLTIIWLLQQHHFIDDIRQIESNSTLKGGLKNLNPFIKQEGDYKLLKVGGRLSLAELPYDQRHPTILPSNCKFIENYVRHLHQQNYHAGPKALVSLIRNRFWITNARRITRRVVNNCIHCIRYKPKLMQQLMGDIPSARITPCRPFSRCAVDFCGPISTYLRIRGKPPYKTYIAVFVCFVTKAVHIELVSDLSTDAFIAALKRLSARRGLPTDIYCDNATNFVGASNKLAELKTFLFDKTNQSKINSFCTNRFINFHFIPPRSPHFGGLWESAVKSAKGLLFRTLGNARMTYEELSTALAEIESILNSRPLTQLSSDPNDYQALTPGHLLIGTSLKSIPERTTGNKDISLIEKWNRITAAKQHFWQQWSRDYLHDLQVRTKWTTPQPNVTIGSLVLVHEDNIPPLHWKMGRVVSTTPGKDQLVRVVDIQTTKGIIRRPIHKIALLPA